MTNCFSLNELFHLGVSKSELNELLSSGRLTRLRRGWFAGALADPNAVRAIRLGGRLGCLSGCRAHGLWVPPGNDLHVIYGAGRKTPSPLDGVQFHRLSTPCNQALADVDQCLAQVIRFHDPESALVVLESAMDRRLISEADARGLIRAAGSVKAKALAHLRTGAQSGSETRVRLFLQRRRIPVRAQVHLDGLGRVDLLAGRSLIIETDSDAHHSSAEAQTRDRGRDLRAWEMGYQFVRLGFTQVWHTWDHTQQVLGSILRSGIHLKHPQPPTSIH